MTNISSFAHRLYVSKVMHRRSTPAIHAFVYRVFSFYLNIDDIDKLDQGLRLFSYNRWNFFSFWDKDHGPRDGKPLRPWINKVLASYGINPSDGSASLLCFPRFFGYAFNPLSIWYWHSNKGVLLAVIYEVRNTFGDHQHYVFRITNDINNRPQDHSCLKKMYVSPFISEQATYKFRILSPGDKLNVQIREYEGSKEVLIATQTGGQVAFTDKALVKLMFTHPLMTIKVSAAIYWQAMQLWRKGISFHGPKTDQNKSI